MTERPPLPKRDRTRAYWPLPNSAVWDQGGEAAAPGSAGSCGLAPGLPADPGATAGRQLPKESAETEDPQAPSAR